MNGQDQNQELGLYSENLLQMLNEEEKKKLLSGQALFGGQEVAPGPGERTWSDWLGLGLTALGSHLMSRTLRKWGEATGHPLPRFLGSMAGPLTAGAGATILTGDPGMALPGAAAYGLVRSGAWLAASRPLERTPHIGRHEAAMAVERVTGVPQVLRLKPPREARPGKLAEVTTRVVERAHRALGLREPVPTRTLEASGKVFQSFDDYLRSINPREMATKTYDELRRVWPELPGLNAMEGQEIRRQLVQEMETEIQRQLVEKVPLFQYMDPGLRQAVRSAVSDALTASSPKEAFGLSEIIRVVKEAEKGGFLTKQNAEAFRKAVLTEVLGQAMQVAQESNLPGGFGYKAYQALSRIPSDTLAELIGDKYSAQMFMELLRNASKADRPRGAGYWFRMVVTPIGLITVWRWAITRKWAPEEASPLLSWGVPVGIAAYVGWDAFIRFIASRAPQLGTLAAALSKEGAPLASQLVAIHIIQEMAREQKLMNEQFRNSIPAPVQTQNRNQPSTPPWPILQKPGAQGQTGQ